MFYVSDITGAQTLYTEELLKLQREQLNSDIAANRLDNQDSFQTARTDRSDQAPNISPNNPSLGTAASSVNSTALSSQSAVFNNRESLNSELDQKRAHRRTVPELTAAKKIQRDELLSSQRDSRPSTSNPYDKYSAPIQKRQRALLASQIMTSPVEVIVENSNIASAIALFESHRFRHLPVVSKQGKLIGILSDRDTLKCSDKESVASSKMASPVLTARPYTEIRQIAEIMFKERVGAMPIVDDAGELVGIITRSDILRTLINKAPLELWI